MLAVFAFALFAAVAGIAHAAPLDPENTVLMDLKGGRAVIKLRPDLAPNHVARIKELTRAKFYDGLTFHRVIPGFMAQTGDPNGDGTGSSKGSNLKAEFTNANFGRGTIGMARSDDHDSANSQFFICYDDCSFLNRQYTVWGEVVQGMEFIDRIKPGDPAVNDGAVTRPDTIVKMTVAADEQ